MSWLDGGIDHLRLAHADGGGAFAGAYADSQILNVPLTFNNYAEVDAARAELDPLIQQGLEDNGWVSFGLVDGGFAYIMSANPVRSLDDLRDQKLWLPSGDSASANAADTLCGFQWMSMVF